MLVGWAQALSNNERRQRIQNIEATMQRFMFLLLASITMSVLGAALAAAGGNGAIIFVLFILSLLAIFGLTVSTLDSIFV
jgi:lipopolysaccharide export LptBFGC system permease protein LptF